MARKPKSLLSYKSKPGYKIAHNHIAHTPNFPLGLNGFRRFWIPPEYIESGEWIQCPCGWRGVPHFAIKEHVEWWKDEIKKGGSLEAVHQYLAQELEKRGSMFW